MKKEMILGGSMLTTFRPLYASDARVDWCCLGDAVDGDTWGYDRETWEHGADRSMDSFCIFIFDVL